MSMSPSSATDSMARMVLMRRRTAAVTGSASDFATPAGDYPEHFGHTPEPSPPSAWAEADVDADADVNAEAEADGGAWAIARPCGYDSQYKGLPALTTREIMF